MQVFAPGKLFVIGEYAVLDGCDAVVAAVSHGVSCSILSGNEVQTPSGDTRFVDAALQAVKAPPRTYRFQTWRPLDVDHKVGLGSSAAACVAAAAAGLLARQQDPMESALQAALDAHFEVQGSGSGRDVMASFFGGLSHFSDGKRSGLAPLPLTVIHSGEPAQTGIRVKAYQALKERSLFLHEAQDLVALFEHNPVEALAGYGELVESCSKQAGFLYQTPAHQRIAELARSHGGAAKPSGAGGGDIAVALIPDEQARQAFVQSCAKAGLQEVPVSISKGLHWTPHA